MDDMNMLQYHNGHINCETRWLYCWLKNKDVNIHNGDVGDTAWELQARVKGCVDLMDIDDPDFRTLLHYAVMNIDFRKVAANYVRIDKKAKRDLAQEHRREE